MDKKHDKMVIAADEGRKHLEKVERKMANKGVGRLDRHPADGLPLKHLPKNGHGGKYTWEGPRAQSDFHELSEPPAIDDNDPNYVAADQGGVEELVVGAVETPKVAEEGVARLHLDPRLQNSNLTK